MKKRTHKNTRRLTAKERAIDVVTAMAKAWTLGGYERIIQRALVAHARDALRRDDRRDKTDLVKRVGKDGVGWYAKRAKK